MFVNTENMISVTQLQRELTKRLRELSETKKPLYVLRNNEVTAVMVSSDEYALLKELEEMIEHLEIYEMIQKRMKHYDPTKHVTLEAVRERYGV